MVPAQQHALYCPRAGELLCSGRKTSTCSSLSIPSLPWFRLCSLGMLQPGAPLRGCSVGCIPMGCVPMGCILMGCILMGCILMGCILTESTLMECLLMGRIPMGCILLGFILVGFILPGFIPLYVRLWQTGGDVVLQDFSFQPQKAGRWQKSTLGVSLARVPPRSPSRANERGAVMNPSFLLHFK